MERKRELSVAATVQRKPIASEIRLNQTRQRAFWDSRRRANIHLDTDLVITDEMKTPSVRDAADVIRSRLGLEPVETQRFPTGLCHHVFSVTASDQQKCVVRIATPKTKRLLAGGVYWNEFLRPIGVPLPRIVATGLEPSEIEFPFVVLEQLPGTDLSQIYLTLTSAEKLEIVSEVVRIREKVSALPEAGGFGFAYSYEEPPAYRT